MSSLLLLEHPSILVLLQLLSSSSVFAFQPVDLEVSFDSQTSPNFKVLLSGFEWLRSGPVIIRDNGQTWASTNKEKNILKPIDRNTESGEDLLGEFDTTKSTWQAFSDNSTPTKVKVETCVSVYRDKPVTTFSIVYTSGLTNASIPGTSSQTLSTFPSFVIEDMAVPSDLYRGYVTWFRGQIKETMVEKWTSQTQVYGDLDGGFPLVIFSETMDIALVLSPATTFMSATQYSFKEPQTGDKILTFGPMSSIEEIPAGYKYSTMLVAGNNVTGVMKEFGEIMMKMYSKTLDYRKNDFSLNYLGYWTDNGACYYGMTGSNYTNYEDLLVAVKEDADKNGLPFRYIQLDYWWYYEQTSVPGSGTTNWTTMPNIFPHGIRSMVNRTGWRAFAHNMWWSPDNVYQKDFKFIVENSASLPIDPKFWDYLLSTAQKDWEMFVYEQDFLYTQFQRTRALQTQLDLGETWLKQMGEAAQRYGITIQYCMAWPRHVMQSVAIPAVTQVRASDDYQPSNNQWQIGDSSILTHSMGLAPSKDNFRTTMSQPDCQKYRGGEIESTPAIETYAAVLSCGPVGPSDQIGTASIVLIKATCMMDGRLLQPTRPALSLDSTFVQRAFGSGGPNGHISVAYTEIGQFTWYYILTGDLSSPYILTAKELPPTHFTFPASSLPAPTIAFQYTLDGNVTKITQFGTRSDFGQDTKLNISQCTKVDFQYWVIPPYLMSHGLILLGELNKIVPVSEVRFSNIIVTADDVMAKVNGVPTEKVPVTVYSMSTNKLQVVDCIISASGVNVLSLSTGICKGG